MLHTPEKVCVCSSRLRRLVNISIKKSCSLCNICDRKIHVTLREFRRHNRESNHRTMWKKFTSHVGQNHIDDGLFAMSTFIPGDRYTICKAFFRRLFRRNLPAVNVQCVLTVDKFIEQSKTIQYLHFVFCTSDIQNRLRGRSFYLHNTNYCCFSSIVYIPKQGIKILQNENKSVRLNIRCNVLLIDTYNTQNLIRFCAEPY